MAAPKLQISETLTLPLDWMTLSTVVYGARGSGKTTGGSVMAEEVYAAGQRFCAIDLKGDWWGLKSSASGEGEGIPVVIFGGDHADLPLEADAGVEIANVIAALEQPSIIDLEHLSKGKQLRFLGAFFERLYDANRDPILLMLDEAQRYAPQKPMSPEANVCLGAVEDLVKLGRKHGIGPMLFTQRGSGLNKEVSELCDMLIAFRTPGSLDQDRIRDWLGANAGKAIATQLIETISGLHTGTAVVASNHPTLRSALPGTAEVVVIRPRRTFDSSATPKIGQRRREPKILARPELEALKEKMASAIERAKADDPKELKTELARLRAELARKPTVQTETVERIVREPYVPPELEQVVTELLSVRGDLERAVPDLGRITDTIAGLLNKEPTRTPAEIIPIRPPTSEDRLERDLQRSLDHVPGPTMVARQSKPDPGQNHAHERVLEYELTKGEKAFLGILAQYPQGRSKTQLAILAGYSAKSGGNYTIIANLRRMEAVEGTESLLRITDKGREILGDDYEPLPTGEGLRDYWLTNPGLSKGDKQFLRLLIDAYPGSMSKTELAEASGYSAKSGGNYTIIANLRRRELVTGTESALRASDELFG